MKKFFILVIICILCCLPLTACNESDNELVKDFVADEQHCVVALPQEYLFSYTNDEQNDNAFDKELYNADTVNGKPKKDGFYYYNVLKNEPFKIVTPLGIINEKNQKGQTLVYWQLNDKLYKDGDNYYSDTIFTCAEDTEITPVYYGFRPVGMLILEADENDNPKLQEIEIFDDNGKIIEQEGVYYYYGVYDFEPNREFWRTNLTINKYKLNHSLINTDDNYSTDFYTINIEIAKDNLFNKGNILVKTLYKIEEHGYMIYSGSNTLIVDLDDLGSATFTKTIGKHEIKYTFV